MTNSCDTCLKVAAERTIIAKQTFDKKMLCCPGANNEHGRATPYLNVHNFGDNGQFALLAKVDFRDSKNKTFSQKIFWRKCSPFLVVSIAFIVMVRLYLQMEITEWLFWTHVNKQVRSPWPHSDMARSLQNVEDSDRSALQPAEEVGKRVSITKNKTKRYIAEEWEHPPSSKEHHLPFGKECEAFPDSAYFSTTRDDGDTHSNSSEISDDTPKSTLMLDRNAPQPLKLISCSDVSEETSKQCQVKVDNLSTRYVRSQQPSVFNSCQTLNNASPLARQHKPSGQTKISGHQVVTAHQQPVCDANQDEDTTTLNNQLTTGNIGKQTTSAGYTYIDHRPVSIKFTSAIFSLPGHEPPGIPCVLDFVEFNVSDSHK